MSRTWETFLRIADPSKQDLAPAADSSWCIQKGIEPEAPEVLVQLRDNVLPLIRRLEQENGLVWYSFLVHAYDIVPTTKDDNNAYIHLRLKFNEDVELADALPKWQFTRAIELSSEIAGVDSKVLDIDEAWTQIGKQSEWLLGFIEKCSLDADGLALVRHMRQFLHFFANATQMRVA